MNQTHLFKHPSQALALHFLKKWNRIKMKTFIHLFNFLDCFFHQETLKDRWSWHFSLVITRLDIPLLWTMRLQYVMMNTCEVLWDNSCCDIGLYKYKCFHRKSSFLLHSGISPVSQPMIHRIYIMSSSYTCFWIFTSQKQFNQILGSCLVV